MAESIPITSAKELRFLRTNPHQDRRLAVSKSRAVHAFDTETDQDANIFLLADSSGNYIDDISAESVIDFLFTKRYQGTWNFFYNLSFDARMILKLLGHELERYNTTNTLEFEYGSYTISYIQTKKLSIMKGHKSTVFFDIAQFYDKTPLHIAYQNNIKKSLDPEYLQMKSVRSNFTRKYYNRNKKLVRKYCIADCILTRELAEYFINLWYGVMKFYPNRWISTGYLAEKTLIVNKIPIPKFNDIVPAVQDIAWKSYTAGWFENFKRGFLEQVHRYDFNSAYPYALSRIPDIVKGKWHNLKHIDKKALIGFFKIECDLPDSTYISPFVFVLPSKRIIHPSGRFQTYCTLAELQAYNKPQNYTILESWQYFDNNPEYPYKSFIENLFLKRKELKDKKDPMQLPLKLTLNSMYGKTAESGKGKQPYGNLFNPVLASTITGTVRAMLYATVQQYSIENDVIGFATDGITTRKKINIDSKELGGLSYVGSDEKVLVIQNGLELVNGIFNKSRGIAKIKNEQFLHSNFHKDGNGNLYYIFERIRPHTLIECIRSGQIEKIGKFEKFVKKVNLNADTKRYWINDIKSYDDTTMCDSLPFTFPLHIDLLNPKLSHSFDHA